MRRAIPSSSLSPYPSWKSTVRRLVGLAGHGGDIPNRLEVGFHIQIVVVEPVRACYCETGSGQRSRAGQRTHRAGREDIVDVSKHKGLAWLVQSLEGLS